MIDTKALINDFDRVSELLCIKKVSEDTLKALKDLAIAYKSTKQELESLQAFQNKGSQKLGLWFRSDGCQDLIDDLKSQLDENKKKMNNV